MKITNVVISMLSTPEVVRSVFVSEGNILEDMQKESIWLDCSTVNPSFSLEMQKIASEKGIRFIDAPVAGTKPHAENAELVFFVGGEETLVEEVTPLMDAMGKKVMHIGAVGHGAKFKMLVNMMLAQSMLVFSEAVLLGEKMGLEKSFLLNTLPNLVVSAPFTKAKAQMISEDNYEVQFPLEWMHKDLHLAAQTAYEHQHPLFLANLSKEIYAMAIQSGYDRMDFAAVHHFLSGQVQQG